MKKKGIAAILVAIFMMMLSGCADPMTPEEEAAYIESHTSTYEVVSVGQYLATKTNRYGGIRSQSVKYYFTYIGNDNCLHEVDDFENLEYGLTKICIGDQNQYVVYSGGFDTYEYLYLTKETLAETSLNVKGDKNE